MKTVSDFTENRGNSGKTQRTGTASNAASNDTNVSSRRDLTGAPADIVMTSGRCAVEGGRSRWPRAINAGVRRVKRLRGFERLAYLANLQGVARFMAAIEQCPLVHVDWAEYGMWLN